MTRGSGARRLVKAAVGAQRALAWDIFLVFGKGKRWADAPPAPDTFMHNQKTNEELSRDRLLNVEKLAGEVKGSPHGASGCLKGLREPAAGLKSPGDLL